MPTPGFEPGSGAPQAPRISKLPHMGLKILKIILDLDVLFKREKTKKQEKIDLNPQHNTVSNLQYYEVLQHP